MSILCSFLFTFYSLVGFFEAWIVFPCLPTSVTSVRGLNLPNCFFFWSPPQGKERFTETCEVKKPLILGKKLWELTAWCDPDTLFSWSWCNWFPFFLVGFWFFPPTRALFWNDPVPLLFGTLYCSLGNGKNNSEEAIFANKIILKIWLYYL